MCVFCEHVPEQSGLSYTWPHSCRVESIPPFLHSNVHGSNSTSLFLPLNFSPSLLPSFLPCTPYLPSSLSPYLSLCLFLSNSIPLSPFLPTSPSPYLPIYLTPYPSRHLSLPTFPSYSLSLSFSFPLILSFSPCLYLGWKEEQRQRKQEKREQ